MLEFYRKKEVYQRNSYCNVTGVYLEVKDPDLASNFMLTRKLRPSGDKPIPINSGAGDNDKENDDDDEF